MIMQTQEDELAIEQEGEKDRLAIPAEVPILPLRQTVVYPLTFLPLSIDRPESIKLIDDVVLVFDRFADSALLGEFDHPAGVQVHVKGDPVTVLSQMFDG